MDDELVEQERNKYERIWNVSTYGDSSPGTKYFQRAWADLVPQVNDSLMDWGIGIGRAAQMFKNKGLRVEGLDIAHNANKEFNGKVHLGCIWDPPFEKNQFYLFGYCTDVMEHIPQERVARTLRMIKKHTVDCCWFSIAMYPDKSGAKIGETLHMTVQPAKWWASQFAKVFPRFKLENDGKRLIVLAFSENLHK